MSIPAEVVERTPEKAKTGLAALYEKGYIPSKLAGVDPHEVIARYLTEEPIASIAKEYGVTPQALGAHLLQYAEEDWRAAQVARDMATLDQSEENMKQAADALSLSRAREVSKLAQWRLSKLHRRIFGDDHQVQVTVIPVLNITTAPLPVVDAPGSRVIEHDENT